MAITINNAWDFDLTQRNLFGLTTYPISPLYIGADQGFRFHVLTAAGVVQSLTSASIVMTLSAPYVATNVTRSTGVAITGSSPTKYQILIDTDQSAETGDTGKGWFQVNFTHYAEDITALSTLSGRNIVYNIKITLADGSVNAGPKGRIDILDGNKAQ